MRGQSIVRSRRGSAPGEQLVMLALAALFVAAAAAAFSHSLARGLALLGTALAAAAAVFALGFLRERRTERRREARCRLALEEAAAARHAKVDALFAGRTAGGPALFGIAGASGTLFYARDDSVRVDVSAVELERVSAAFARPGDGNRYRLEVRSHGAGAPLHLTVAGRDEACRWIDALAPRLGARAKLLDNA